MLRFANLLKKSAILKTPMLPDGSYFPQREAERPRGTTVSRQNPNSRPEKSQTENRLFYKRPLTESRPRPQTQVVLLPPNPVLTACDYTCNERLRSRKNYRSRSRLYDLSAVMHAMGQPFAQLMSATRVGVRFVSE